MLIVANRLFVLSVIILNLFAPYFLASDTEAQPSSLLLKVITTFSQYYALIICIFTLIYYLNERVGGKSESRATNQAP
jgi:hypothetical protein